LVDSRTGSMALGFQAQRGAELAAAGLDAPVIAETLRAEVERHHVVFFVDTLDYLQRGGRIGRAAALIGGILQLKPLLRIDEGQVVPWERTRTRTRALNGLVEFAKGLPAVDRVAALYSSDRGEGAAFADRLAADLALDRDRVVLAQIGPTVAAHIGPGAMGLAAMEAPP
jgi:DegV family protein with EDD domain